MNLRKPSLCAEAQILVNQSLISELKLPTIWSINKDKDSLSELLETDSNGISKYRYSSMKHDGVARVIKGPLKFENGIIYKGQWNISEDCKDGQGVQLWPDGSKYEGYWKHNQANGEGRLIAKGDIYEGNWKDDKAHGYGIYKYLNGAIYEGEWIDDRQSGKGKETWPDGSNYTGDFFDGKNNAL